MGKSSSAIPTKSFWDQYIKLVQDVEKRPRMARWYVLRAEQYLRESGDTDPARHKPADLEMWLRAIGRSRRLESWQFAQIVDAMQILFERLLKTDWAASFDWNYWKTSAQALAASHSTVARETPVRGSEPARSAGSALASARAQHTEVFDRLVIEIRQRAYSIRTEQAYEQWVARFILFCNNADPGALGGADVRRFLEHLVVDRNVAASTQSQALNALVFLYGQVLHQALPELESFARAQRPRRLPAVLTQQQVRELFVQLSGVHELMARLLYGTGMRLMECIRLRVKDIDFDYRQLVVRNGKGAKDRVVPLPDILQHPLVEHLAEVKQTFDEDLADGLGEVFMPEALARKYPGASREWQWQYVFPSKRLSIDPRGGKARRHHLHENGLQRAVKTAALIPPSPLRGRLYARRVRAHRGPSSSYLPQVISEEKGDALIFLVFRPRINKCVHFYPSERCSPR